MTVYNLLTKLSTNAFICIERKECGLKFITTPILNDLLTKENGFFYQEIKYIYPKIVEGVPVLAIRI